MSPSYNFGAAMIAAMIASGSLTQAIDVWAQCGGQGFTVSGSCAVGSTCVVVNSYYSQCQPGAITSFSTTLAKVALTSTTSAATTSVVTSATAPSSTAGLDFDKAAKAAGKLWFGSAFDTTQAEVKDAAYMKIFNDSNIFGQTTPGNTMKWEFVEPAQNTFTFSQGEQTIALANQTGKKVRCHNLVWSSELPSWVTSGTWTNATLLAAMENHITKTIEGFGESCYSWDVVNEALSSTGYQSNPFYTYIGEAYVPLAFKAATAAIKGNNYDIKLFYNDYGIEEPGSKNTAAVNLVKEIQAYGAQIDGVGFESHFQTTYFPTTAQVISAMQGFTDLGLDVHVTELDVACPSNSPTAANLATQAQAYYDTVSACMQTTNCTGMTVWDFDDAYSWITPASNNGQGDADLFYSSLATHPATQAVMDAIQGQACSVCS